MSIYDMRDQSKQLTVANRQPKVMARAKVYSAPEARPVPAWLPLLLLLQTVAGFWFLFQMIR